MLAGLTAGLIMVAANLPLPMYASAASTPCPKELELIGACPSNDGNEIIIDGRLPGTPVGPGEPGTYPIDNGDPGTDAPGSPPPEFDFGRCLEDWDSYMHCFRPPEDPEDIELDGGPDTPAIPAITITDVARFAPAGSTIAGEPDNVGVAGLPTNFVASASTHTVEGSLFGFPVSVRFAPVGYDFAFGDGTTNTTTDGGQPWTALEQAQFTPTPTSHTYAQRGEYTAQVDVRYSAEVDFGIGWFPIEGEVTAAGPPQQIRIFEAHTALVARTCQQAPNSPGC